MTFDEIALSLTVEMLRKSGVREWDEPDTRAAITTAAVEMAAYIYGNSLMATSKTLVAAMDGTPPQISFADHGGDFSPANNLEVGTPTDCQISLTGVANGAARQSVKVDLGAVRALLYSVRAAIELAATPTAGNTIDFYWAPSGSGTAGTANPGNISGTDAAYAGYSSNLTATLPQLQYIGSLVCTAQATGTVQYGEVGTFMPRERYGSLVVVNNSGAAVHSDDVECNVVFDPIVPQGQAA